MSKMNMSRRSFLKLSTGATAAAILGQFAPFAIAQDTVNLRIASWDSASSVEGFENEILALFHDQFPNIQSGFEFITDSYSDKILTGLAGGSAPDVFLWWNFPQLVQRGGLEDITPFIEADGSFDASIYFPQVLDYGRVGDGLYGLPKDFTPRSIYYNKTLFDEAGIPYPTDEWTFADLQEMTVALTQGEGPNKQFGFWTYDGIYVLQPWVWSNGGDFISPDGMQATGYLDSPETIEVLDWYIKLQTELGVSPSTTQEGQTVGANELFLNNQLAIYDSGRWPQPTFEEAEGLEFGTVLPPRSNNGDRVTVLHQSAWSMAPTTENKQEAWELIKWLGGEEANRIRAEARWGLPALASTAEEFGLVDDELNKVWFDAVPFATVPPCFLRNFNWSLADEEINLAIQSAYAGQTSVEDALKATAPIVDSILQDV